MYLAYLSVEFFLKLDFKMPQSQGQKDAHVQPYWSLLNNVHHYLALKRV